MILLIDSNIVLDYMLRNEGRYENAQYVLLMAEIGIVDGYVTASALTDIYYIASKAHKSKEIAFGLIKKLVEQVRIAAVDDGVIKRAIDIRWNDFEDSVQYATGKSISADYIVTRDSKDFNKSTIPVISPESLVELLLTD
ncbi:MAG: PIN domain-containing protein [Coriobacteriales bacterium]|jgi:predicted nucleic acid-binding protein|nr:PIN domain-containing protein [Coriobacteriales bacterium]